MCECLGIHRSIYYSVKDSQASPKKNNEILEEAVKKLFADSRRTYGTRRIRSGLKSEGITASRRKIADIMSKFGLVSKYTKAYFKPHKAHCNEDPLPNVLDRHFDGHAPMEAVVSDLTYVRVGTKWNYICILLDLCRRRIIGFSAGAHKDAKLVARAFASVNGNLSKIRLFHTDRGAEFKNDEIERLLHTFGIERSLSMKGCPYDNAVAEATFKTIKTEFVYDETFDSLSQLQIKLADYVHWYNNIRIHSSLGYSTPVHS